MKEKRKRRWTKANWTWLDNDLRRSRESVRQQDRPAEGLAQAREPPREEGTVTLPNHDRPPDGGE